MPIIKSAKKRMRQSAKKRVANHATLANMRSLVKNVFRFSKEKAGEKVGDFFSQSVSAIDKCVKKNLLHKNNAARKKSRIFKAVDKLQQSGVKVQIKKLEKPQPKKVAKKPQVKKAKAKPSKAA